MEHLVSSRSLIDLRKPLPWLLATAAGAALFASGVLVANALQDDASAPETTKVIAPGIGADGMTSSGAEASLPAGPMTNGGRGGADMTYPACTGPLPAGVIASGVIDPSKAGFIPALPGDGFTPSNISLSTQGDCGPDGVSKHSTLVLASTWQHDATGLGAFVSQRATDTAVANVLRPDSAVFWANGYEFTVSVNGYVALPYASRSFGSDSGAAAPEKGGVTSQGASPAMPAPGGEIDPRVADVLRQLVSQLAPSLDQKCFWTLAKGDWDAVTAAGVGDPRPAIPSGFSESDLSVMSLVPPAAGCDASIKPTDGFGFNAGWQKSGSNDFSYIGVSVFSNGESQPFPGQLNEYGANWSNGTFNFGVYAKSEKPVGIDTIKAIARALDPSFNEACFIQDRELKESELAGLGFRAAAAPEGYKLAKSSLRVQGVADGCPKPAGFEPTYALAWTFEGGADTIEASVNRYGGEESMETSGFRAPNSLSWTRNNTHYAVSAYSRGISPTVPIEHLVAVAKSMDPEFDLSELSEGGPGKPVDPPVPAGAAR